MQSPSHRLPALASLLGLIALLAWDRSPGDLLLAQLAGSAHGFPLRDHWLLATALHEAPAAAFPGATPAPASASWPAGLPGGRSTPPERGAGWPAQGCRAWCWAWRSSGAARTS
jgi:hypothetical protein